MWLRGQNAGVQAAKTDVAIHRPLFNPLQKLPLSLSLRKEMSARETAALGRESNGHTHKGWEGGGRGDVIRNHFAKKNQIRTHLSERHV